MRSRPRLSRLATAATVLLAALIAACEGSNSHVDGPRGASAFANYMALGTGLSMGVQSGGVMYASQLQAWPALLAHAAGAGLHFVVSDTLVNEVVSFRLPLFRTPGCLPPLVAPLNFAVDLAGTSIMAGDSICAGASDTTTPPTNNLAIAGASAWDALNLTPKTVVNALVPYSAGDRARYPLVLGSTQSQVTALRVQTPTFVSVELGLSEVLGAATSGLVVAATSYGQAAAYTYVPAAVFAPVFAAIADSVALTKAKVVLVSVPKVSALYALRPASEIWNDSTELAGFGVTVNANCATSPNFIFTAARIPLLAAQFAATGTQLSLSCADVPGTADGVLTPADITMLDGAVSAMNAQIQQVAQANGWAFADLTGVYPPAVSSRTPYKASDELTCVYPYGAYVSLDGAFPSAQGQAAIATAVAAAIDAQYGFNLTVGTTTPTGITAAKLCP